ncbi:MAG: biotin--[acetyl-CoA-carboxylase] ligase [Desulfobacteraceae bacterium]|jgi:BirA family biotin operon repressor/biotin-[acetyl-CoA-carboxylase] ligase|nr:biotin--[acetyl-CoA-carboxylase] ligase [Desulfobacteraceae bacterium]
MTGRISILDFDKQDLFEATEPETIARTSRIWKKDIANFGPWTRIRTNRFGIPENELIWKPKHSGDGPAVLVCGNCSSTMDAAWHFIENRQLAIWDSVIAVEQIAGRGQQKRQWISPAGNIHASWLWPLPKITGKTKTDWGGMLSLVVGFIFARVLKKLNVPVQIKWPNDLLINNQKFAGILVERRENNILVGIGINVNYSPENSKLREEFAVPATSLLDQGHEMAPLSLWMTLVEKGKFLFEQLIQTLTPSEFIKMIDMQMAWIGKKVLIRQINADIFEAVILGLADDGGLRIKKGHIEEVMYSGSIIPV